MKANLSTLVNEIASKRCIIHNEQASISDDKSEVLEIHTCCYLFKSQLYLLVDDNDLNSLIDVRVI